MTAEIVAEIEDYTPRPPLAICGECGMRAPRRGGICVVCAILGIGASIRTIAAPPPRLVPSPLPSPPAPPSSWSIWGASHPDPRVEAEARRRSSAPPRAGRESHVWYAALERHRVDAERAIAALDRRTANAPATIEAQRRAAIATARANVMRRELPSPGQGFDWRPFEAALARVVR